jgi:hypothetical protein
VHGQSGMTSVSSHPTKDLMQKFRRLLAVCRCVSEHPVPCRQWPRSKGASCVDDKHHRHCLSRSLIDREWIVRGSAGGHKSHCSEVAIQKSQYGYGCHDVNKAVMVICAPRRRATCLPESGRDAGNDNICMRHS